ncbi:hypothetical protein ES706_04922 [subsurface metagenome]
MPPGEKINVKYTDDFTLDAYTYSADSVRSDKMGQALLGSKVDPVFGTSKADFITQARLSEAKDFGTNPVADSLVLFLLTAGFYGDGETDQILEVFELIIDLDEDSSYYSNLSLEGILNETFIGTTTFRPSDTLISVKLNTSIAQKIVDSINYEHQEEFLEVFKGLYVTSENVTERGGIVNLDLLSSDSKLTIYYHTDTDTISYDFVINESSVRINRFSHDYETADIAYEISHLDDSIHDTVIYTMGMGGVYTLIDLSFLESWRDTMPVAINNAEIIVSLSAYDPFSEMFPPPEKLELKTMNENNEFILVFDALLGDDYFGGKLDEENGLYHFKITIHLQDFLLGKTDDLTVYLFVGDSNISPCRVVLSNGENSNKIKLKLTYSRL